MTYYLVWFDSGSGRSTNYWELLNRYKMYGNILFFGSAAISQLLASLGHISLDRNLWVWHTFVFQAAALLNILYFFALLYLFDEIVVLCRNDNDSSACSTLALM